MCLHAVRILSPHFPDVSSPLHVAHLLGRSSALCHAPVSPVSEFLYPPLGPTCAVVSAMARRQRVVAFMTAHQDMVSITVAVVLVALLDVLVVEIMVVVEQ